jgi:hypothetical protein
MPVYMTINFYVFFKDYCNKLWICILIGGTNKKPMFQYIADSFINSIKIVIFWILIRMRINIAMIKISNLNLSCR